MSDSHNVIDHKCPCCGYEVEHAWDKSGEYKFIKGDESFVIISCRYGISRCFETDRPREVDWGSPAYENVFLLGCPKCRAVSFTDDW